MAADEKCCRILPLHRLRLYTNHRNLKFYQKMIKKILYSVIIETKWTILHEFEILGYIILLGNVTTLVKRHNITVAIPRDCHVIFGYSSKTNYRSIQKGQGSLKDS